MNILFYFYLPICPSVGGIERVTDILATEFKRRGFNVIFLCPESNDIDYEKLQRNQYVVNFSDTTNAQLKIKLILKENDINIIINQFTLHDIPNSLLLLNTASKNIIKISCYHSDPFYFIDKERIIQKLNKPKGMKAIFIKYLSIIFPFAYRYAKVSDLRKKYALILKNSDRLCLLSETFIPDFKKLMNISETDANKICSINNPVDYKFNAGNLPKTDKRNTILFIARLYPSKNPKDFLKVWKILNEKNPVWEAVVVGDGPELNNLKKYSTKHHLKNIHFEGHQEDVAIYYEQAKFICLTSHYEGWGMVLIEGMLHGCVPIAYNTYNSVSDIIDNDVCGYITKPYSPLDMAQKIQSLIDDDNKFNSFSEEAKKKTNYFSSSKIVDRWEELFKNILDEQSSK